MSKTRYFKSEDKPDTAGELPVDFELNTMTSSTVAEPVEEPVVIEQVAPEELSENAMYAAYLDAFNFNPYDSTFARLNQYLNQYRHHADFDNIFHAFLLHASDDMQSRFPNISIPLFLDITHERKSPQRVEFLNMMKAYRENISLSTRLIETYQTGFAFARRHPIKFVTMVLSFFTIVVGGILFGALWGRIKPAGIAANTTLPPTLPPTPAPTTLEPLPTQSVLPNSIISAWAYDAILDPRTGKVTSQEPGGFADDIIAFNDNATAGHTLDTVYPYGGSVEAYEPISNKSLFFYYDAGKNNTLAYCAAAKKGRFRVMPVVDGRVDSTELRSLNTMSVQNANLFADLVTEKVFANDNCSAGIQFDIEPFDITAVGQQNFFTKIARNFASTNFNCKNELFPSGRYFSVFTDAAHINQDVARIFAGNGYIIDPLFNLKSSSTPTSLSEYQLLVDREIKAMLQKSATYNVKYQFAIPAAASAHEFESKDNIASHISQQSYVEIAVKAIEANGVRRDRNFKGIGVWAFAHSIMYRSKLSTPTIFEPSRPNQTTLELLQRKI